MSTTLELHLTSGREVRCRLPLMLTRIRLAAARDELVVRGETTERLDIDAVLTVQIAALGLALEERPGELPRVLGQSVLDYGDRAIEALVEAGWTAGDMMEAARQVFEAVYRSIPSMEVIEAAADPTGARADGSPEPTP